MSGYTRCGDRGPWRRSPPKSAFLAKPFTADSLLAAVEQVMG